MLQLHIQSSYWDLFITLASHAGALLALVLTPITPLLVFACALPIVVNGGYHVWRWHPMHPECIRKLDIAAQHCVITTATDRVTTQLPVPRYVSEWLIILRCPPTPDPIASAARRRSIVITLYPDSLASDADRQLRRYLRFDCPAATRGD